MSRTKVSLIVPHTFAKQGEYDVSVGGNRDRYDPKRRQVKFA
jgi:hypothetical protein